VSDIDTIRERHWQNPDGKCASADHAYPSAWPCDTRVVLDTLDRALVAAEGLAEADKRHRDAHEMASWYEDRERAARADADRLAEALRDAIAVAHETDSLRSHSDDERKDGWFRASFDRCNDAICADAREALRQHDEEVA